jgi:hypothetical protein
MTPEESNAELRALTVFHKNFDIIYANGVGLHWTEAFKQAMEKTRKEFGG